MQIEKPQEAKEVREPELYHALRLNKHIYDNN